MGNVAFSRYSQAADLSKRSVIWYAVLGVGTALLTLVAAGMALATHPGRTAATALTLTIVATVVHSIATARAAPTNFSQRGVSDNDAALGVIFKRFTRWQTLRVTAQVACLLAVLWALAALDR